MKITQPSPVLFPILMAIGLLVTLPLLGIMATGLPLGRYLEFPPLTTYVEHSGFSWPVFSGLALLVVFVTLPFIIRVLFAKRTINTQVNPPVAGTVMGRLFWGTIRWPSRAPSASGRILMEPFPPAPSEAKGPPRLGRGELACHAARVAPQRGDVAEQSGHLQKITDKLPGTFALVGRGGYSCTQNARRFPVWGWLGLAFGIGAWILAWSRFAWFAPLQPFTFSPLWFSYIITVNALTHRRTGQCLLTQRPVFLLMLLAVSAAFWWLFEYLNRFVQNWYYIGIGTLTPLEYFVFATLPFSTVLPAVMGTFHLLATYPRLSKGLSGIFTLLRIDSRCVAAIVLTLSAAGLAGIGVWPDYLFPLLWLAPPGVLASLQTLTGQTSLFADLVHGDWRRIVLLALAALICGIFWEMWNFYSAAKWVYAVPFVNRFHIFEMPALGYAGYLPFGLECALIFDLLCGSRLSGLAVG